MNLRPVFFFCLLAAAAVSTAAQSSPLPDAPEPAVALRTLPRELLRDQAAIWTSPIRLRDSNAAGPVVLVLATTVVVTTDHQAMSHIIAKDGSLKSRSDSASQALTGGFIALPAVLYGFGRRRGDDHAARTGLLGGEAIVDSLVVNEGIRIVARRERPDTDGVHGRFFQPGVNFNSSFASNHSVIAWSSAAVVASEYPGWMTQLLAYGAASGVSVARVLAQQHFPSDVVAASGVGWMIGRYVVRRHRRHEIE